MATSKFEEYKDLVLGMAKFGLTDKQMAEVLGITSRTIDNWKVAHPTFFQSLKKVKALSDANVERSLYERATGYECIESKVFNNDGEPLIVPVLKKYPPDTTAAIFWLKNRQRNKWTDVNKGDDTVPITIVNNLPKGD